MFSVKLVLWLCLNELVAWIGSMYIFATQVCVVTACFECWLWIQRWKRSLKPRFWVIFMVAYLWAKYHTSCKEWRLQFRATFCSWLLQGIMGITDLSDTAALPMAKSMLRTSQKGQVCGYVPGLDIDPEGHILHVPFLRIHHLYVTYCCCSYATNVAVTANAQDFKILVTFNREKKKEGKKYIPWP